VYEEHQERLKVKVKVKVTVTVKVKVKVMLRLAVDRSVSQSVCLGVVSTVELVIIYYFLSESCCIVSVGRPLLREVGSVSCHSLSAVFSPLSTFYFIYILHVTPISGLC
jgi:hypothetical protein